MARRSTSQASTQHGDLSPGCRVVELAVAQLEEEAVHTPHKSRRNVCQLACLVCCHLNPTILTADNAVVTLYWQLTAKHICWPRLGADPSS